MLPVRVACFFIIFELGRSGESLLRPPKKRKKLLYNPFIMTIMTVTEQEEKIKAVLDCFKIGYEGMVYTEGPSVTLFEFRPEIGVKMSKIRGIKDELAVALRVPGVRIIIPTPNGTVGIEVPVTKREIVRSSRLMSTPEYENTDMALPLMLGLGIDNRNFMVDLAEMPHLLVAGATGMGKSVCLNTIIMSLLSKRTPDEMRLVLIDPKQVEFSVFNRIGDIYLAKLARYTDAVLTESRSAHDTLNGLCVLMDDRYTTLKNAKVRNIREYNEAIGQGRINAERMLYYVVIIDEYGDLIMTSSDHDVEKFICRIAQKARAVGIHMIISTQRPAANIVTGNIKANFPTRIAFRTTTGTDSRVIIDQHGAEKLTGKGDMLYFNGGEIVRVQCAYTSTEEVDGLCDALLAKYPHTTPAFLPAPDPNNEDGIEMGDGSTLYRSSYWITQMFPTFDFITYRDVMNTGRMKSIDYWPSIWQLKNIGLLKDGLKRSEVDPTKILEGFYPTTRDPEEIHRILKEFDPNYDKG